MLPVPSKDRILYKQQFFLSNPKSRIRRSWRIVEPNMLSQQWLKGRRSGWRYLGWIKVDISEEINSKNSRSTAENPLIPTYDTLSCLKQSKFRFPEHEYDKAEKVSSLLRYFRDT